MHSPKDLIKALEIIMVRDWRDKLVLLKSIKSERIEISRVRFSARP
jgi:hypothetical protein